MRSAVELLQHRPGGENGMLETRDEREKAMRWKRKETSVKTFLVFVTMAAVLSLGVQNALYLCIFICIFMVCARLHEWIPSEKAARINRMRPTRALNNGGERDLVIWIGYDPPNLLQRPVRFVGTISGIVQCLFYFLSVALFADHGFIFVCGVLVVDLIFGYYINVAVDKQERISRANLLFTKEGLGFDYSVVGLEVVTPLLPWDKIESVTFARTHWGCFETAALQFRVSSAKFPSECDNITSNFPGNFFVEDIDGVPIVVINVRADGFASPVHRRDLIEFISARVAPEKILGRQEQLASTQINDPGNPSYTAIWLDSLSASNTFRLRNTDLQPGTSLNNGRYSVKTQLGAGGQGVAYTAVDTLSDEIVVLKEFVLPQSNRVDTRVRAASTVLSEADLLRGMHHPNIVQLLDNFVEDHRAYLVIEHVEGADLRKYVIEHGPFAEFQALGLGLQMCEVLSYLHSLPVPVIHRDFTPDNLIYSPTGKVKLLDFNVAQQLDSVDTRAVVGKHSYLPPEQFRGKATIQSDLYALGATMFFLLTGHDPEPISTSHPAEFASHISAELDAVVAKATEPILCDRYENADVLGADLKRLLKRNPLFSS